MARPGWSSNKPCSIIAPSSEPNLLGGAGSRLETSLEPRVGPSLQNQHNSRDLYAFPHHRELQGTPPGFIGGTPQRAPPNQTDTSMQVPMSKGFPVRGQSRSMGMALAKSRTTGGAVCETHERREHTDIPHLQNPGRG